MVLGLLNADELLLGWWKGIIDFEGFGGLLFLSEVDGFVGVVGFDGMGEFVFPQ